MMGTSTLPCCAILYSDNIAVIFLLVLSVADVRNKNSAGSRNSELKAFVPCSEFISSALFGWGDTLTFRGGFRCHGLVHNPPIRCSNTGSFCMTVDQ